MESSFDTKMARLAAVDKVDSTNDAEYVGLEFVHFDAVARQRQCWFDNLLHWHAPEIPVDREHSLDGTRRRDQRLADMELLLRGAEVAQNGVKFPVLRGRVLLGRLNKKIAQYRLTVDRPGEH